MNSLVVLCFFLVMVSGDAPLKNPSLRIVGGQVAQPKQLPYQARLEVRMVKNGIFSYTLCGGALISNNTILTAAHCLENAISAIIYLGVTQNSEKLTSVIRIASSFSKQLKKHERYNHTTLENDIAVIKLSPPVELNDAVKTVNLPSTDQTNLENRIAVFAGFGKIGPNATFSTQLLYANRKIVPASKCQIFKQFVFNPSVHLCIDDSENTSVCSGDSGGPLVTEESDGSKTVVGILSFGLLTCDRGYPGVFIKVSHYNSWIKTNMF